jgi:membrane protease YdiL (CAAX protease family)
MSGVPATLTTASPPEALPERATGRKWVRWFEVCLVLLVAFGDALFNALYLLEHGPSAALTITGWRWSLATSHEIIALLLLGYVLHKSGRRFRDIGLRWAFRDIGTGVLVLSVSVLTVFLVLVPVFLFYRHVYGIFPSHHKASEFFGHFSFWALPYFLIGPFYEELIVRAYLMTEIRELTGSAALSVLVSVALQGSYHLYYGWWGALTVSLMFLVLALYFARWRRAWPVVIAHEIFDIFALTHL